MACEHDINPLDYRCKNCGWAADEIAQGCQYDSPVREARIAEFTRRHVGPEEVAAYLGRVLGLGLAEGHGG